MLSYLFIRKMAWRWKADILRSSKLTNMAYVSGTFGRSKHEYTLLLTIPLHFYPINTYRAKQPRNGEEMATKVSPADSQA
jgi:hypothetical protein